MNFISLHLLPQKAYPQVKEIGPQGKWETHST